MATRKTEKKEKPAGQWQSKTLATWKQSKSSVWRAQVSTSPEGKKFTGVRQYIIKADGTEIAGKAGITFLNDTNLSANLDKVIDLFTSLKGNKRDKVSDVVAGEDSAEKPKKTRTKKVVEEEEAPVFGFINEDETAWLKSWRVNKEGSVRTASTEDEDDAKPFNSEAEAKADLAKYKKAGGKSDWRVVRLN